MKWFPNSCVTISCAVYFSLFSPLLAWSYTEETIFPQEKKKRVGFSGCTDTATESPRKNGSVKRTGQQHARTGRLFVPWHLLLHTKEIWDNCWETVGKLTAIVCSIFFRQSASWQREIFLFLLSESVLSFAWLTRAGCESFTPWSMSGQLSNPLFDVFEGETSPFLLSLGCRAAGACLGLQGAPQPLSLVHENDPQAADALTCAHCRLLASFMFPPIHQASKSKCKKIYIWLTFFTFISVLAHFPHI